MRLKRIDENAQHMRIAVIRDAELGVVFCISETLRQGIVIEGDRTDAILVDDIDCAYRGMQQTVGSGILHEELAHRRRRRLQVEIDVTILTVRDPLGDRINRRMVRAHDKELSSRDVRSGDKPAGCLRI